MNKELFMESIEAIRKQYEHDVETSQMLGKAFPNAFEANLLPDNQLLQNQLVKILQIEMNDLDVCKYGQSWIEWFCWECDFGKKSNQLKAYDKNGKVIPLANAGELYDFLNDF